MSINRIAGVFLLTLIAFPAGAQGRTHFGLKLGLASTELRHDDGFGGDAVRRVIGGAFAAVPVRGPFGALAQVDYFRKGYGAGELRDETNTQLGTDADFLYDYLSFLVAPRYEDALGSSGLDLYAFVGPRLDLLLSDRVVATTPDGDRGTIEVESAFLDDFNSAVFGASAGIGLNLADAVSVPILVELRYDADVTPAWSNDFGDWRFRAFSFRVGYSF